MILGDVIRMSPDDHRHAYIVCGTIVGVDLPALFQCKHTVDFESFRLISTRYKAAVIWSLT